MPHSIKQPGTTPGARRASTLWRNLTRKRGDWEQALEHIEQCLRTNADDLNARNLAVLLLRELGRRAEADETLTATLKLDPLDPWAGHLADGAFTADDQTRLDVAFDYARAGFYEDAARLLETAKAPMLMYLRAFCEAKLGRSPQESLAAAAEVSPDYCFPSRLDEMLVLQFAIEVNPPDARARYYLGNLLYDRRRHREAIVLWEQSAVLDPTFSVMWRNLGIGYFNILRDAAKAQEAFQEPARQIRRTRAYSTNKINSPSGPEHCPRRGSRPWNNILHFSANGTI